MSVHPDGAGVSPRIHPGSTIALGFREAWTCRPRASDSAPIIPSHSSQRPRREARRSASSIRGPVPLPRDTIHECNVHWKRRLPGARWQPRHPEKLPKVATRCQMAAAASRKSGFSGRRGVRPLDWRLRSAGEGLVGRCRRRCWLGEPARDIAGLCLSS